MAEAGFVHYVSDDYLPSDQKWNEVYLNELEQFDGGRRGHDDQVDSTSDGFNYVRQVQTIPNFSIASFTTQNRFSRD